MFCIYVFNHCATLRLSRFLNRISRDIFIVYVVKMLGRRTRCQDELLQHFGKNLPLIATETILPVGAFNHLKKMSRARKFVSISFSFQLEVEATLHRQWQAPCQQTVDATVDCWGRRLYNPLCLWTLNVHWTQTRKKPLMLIINIQRLVVCL